MELTRDEMLTMWVVLDVLENKMPYREVNKHIGSMTLDMAYELYKKIDREINADNYDAEV